MINNTEKTEHGAKHSSAVNTGAPESGNKKFGSLKNCRNFVVLLQEAIYQTTEVVAFFMCTSENYRSSNGCCTSQSVIVSCKVEGDSFFNF